MVASDAVAMNSRRIAGSGNSGTEDAVANTIETWCVLKWVVYQT